MPHYSKWAWMPAGTALNLDLLLVNIIGYRLKVYPTGFDGDRWTTSQCSSASTGSSNTSLRASA
jgi:hypothetical protein